MRYLLLDRIEEVAPDRARGWKTVAMSEDFLEWHFPERPILPGSLVLEAFAQLAGWHEALTSGFSRWFLVERVASARYFGFSGPGDRVDLALEVVPTGDPARRAYRGEASVGGERRAAVELEGIVVALDDLDDRARVERLSQALRGVRMTPASRGGRP